MTSPSALPTLLPAVRFHISLNVSDLKRSVHFYEILFDRPPAKLRRDYAKFETELPPLVLSLEPNGKAGPGTLNHLGIRLSDARQLVAVQERLEKSGIHSQREEGVQCCYAQQTKFWVHDPDGTLWEFYVMEDDNLSQRGPGQSLEVMTSSTLPEPRTVWEHRLGEAFPDRMDACDRSLDEIRLRGTLNATFAANERSRMLQEIRRVLKPGGRVFLQVLSGEKEHASPELPGPASAVRFVPAKDDVMQLLSAAGFRGLRLLKYDDPPCFVYADIAMRETHIEAFSPE